MAREEIVSVLLGYTSIACWLGAQFPQVIVNLKRKSVDGLALPFLANWLLGDTTNLIGCLLTDQLPFQTYLATYFVLVDICLVSQYIYYDAPRDAKALSILTSPSARQSRTSLASPYDAHFPRTHIPRVRSRSYSLDPGAQKAASNLALATSDVQQDSITSDAELHASQSRRRPRVNQRATSLERLPESLVAETQGHNWGGRGKLLSQEHDEADDESESAPSIMIDSFHSEAGGRGRNKGKHISWTRDSTSRDRESRALSQDPLASEPHSPQTAPATMRGRQLTRATIYDSPSTSEAEIVLTTRERRISDASVVSAATSRRGASIVFLAVFALFGLSSQAGYRPFGASPSESSVLNIPPIPVAIPSAVHLEMPLSALPSGVIVHLQDFEPSVYTSFADGDTKKFIGRISAWTCTTFYITSRLPQIWKNYVRKSVAGLSMYLFIFAFLGNFFYVFSILASPKMDLPPPLAKQFLRDSIPYLLGSGGTLIFDVTIVTQSIVYGRSRRSLRARARRKSLVSSGGEEERALLAAERDADDR